MAAARWTEKQIAATNAGKLTRAKKVKAVVEKRRVMLGGVAVDKKSKYFNERNKFDGIWFDSIKEREYYKRLMIERRAGKVTWFAMQVPFRLAGGIKYIADFVVVRDDPLVMGSTVQVIDTKGFETDVFKLKRKLMRDIGVEILIE